MKKSNDTLKKDIGKYIKTIKSSLYCKRRTKTKFIKDLKANIDDYLLITPEANFENVLEHFGTPDLIADEFAANSNANLLKSAKSKKHFRLIVIVILAAIALFIGTIAFIIAKNNNRTAAYYYYETVSDLGTNN